MLRVVDASILGSSQQLRRDGIESHVDRSLTTPTLGEFHQLIQIVEVAADGATNRTQNAELDHRASLVQGSDSSSALLWIIMLTVAHARRLSSLASSGLPRESDVDNGLMPIRNLPSR